MLLLALLYLAALLIVPFYIGPEVAQNAQINAERVLLILLAASIFTKYNFAIVRDGLSTLARERALLLSVVTLFFAFRLLTAFVSPHSVSVLIVLNEIASNLLVFVVFFSLFLKFDLRREIELVLSIGVVVMFLVTLFELAAGYNPLTQFAPANAGSAINSADMQRDGFLRVKATFEHGLTLGHAIVMILPFFLFVSRMPGLYRYSMIAMLLLMAMFTGSRTSILLAIAEVGLAFVILAPQLRFGNQTVSTRTLALGLAGISLIVAVGIAQSVSGKGVFESYIREAQINNGLIAIQAKPWFGYGPGPGALEALLDGMRGVGALRMWRANLTTVDNWYLTVLLTSGWPGLLLFVTMVGLIAKQGIELLVTNRILHDRLRRFGYRPVVYMAAMSVVFGLGFMLTLSIFTVHPLFYLFAAWLTAAYVHTARDMVA